LPAAAGGPYDAPVILRHVLALAISLLPSLAGAQPRPAEEVAREREFIEALRREDPAEADRFASLSETRTQAIADLRRAEIQYNAAGPELRASFVAPLRRAQRAYAEASIALLDFLDARERRAIARYQEEIQRLQQHQQERQQTRAELQKLLSP
jgi:hypothetical protein